MHFANLYCEKFIFNISLSFNTILRIHDWIIEMVIISGGDVHDFTFFHDINCFRGNIDCRRRRDVS